MTYTLSSFAYDLPAERIAQYPADRRDESRLLNLERSTGNVSHKAFRDLPALLEPGDLLVVNRSRVIPARLTATRENGREAEVLLVREHEPGLWSAMVHPGGKLKRGRRLSFGEFGDAVVEDVIGGGLRVIRFEHDRVRDIWEACGSVPLPPYIDREAEPTDLERYQTIFAHEDGSVAAPTAGLHFTENVVRSLGERGVALAEITLHVGPGTFKPVSSEDITRHSMHAEYYRILPEAADAINRTRETGGRVCAVGTTSARVLETTTASGVTQPGEGMTDIFIYPPYRFTGIDALLTNFHLPHSTLLMLVAAFAGLETVLEAYREAVRERYRFFSYGDAMLIT